jgi:hypothetical protein
MMGGATGREVNGWGVVSVEGGGDADVEEGGVGCVVERGEDEVFVLAGAGAGAVEAGAADVTVLLVMGNNDDNGCGVECTWPVLVTGGGREEVGALGVEVVAWDWVVEIIGVVAGAEARAVEAGAADVTVLLVMGNNDDNGCGVECTWPVLVTGGGRDEVGALGVEVVAWDWVVEIIGVVAGGGAGAKVDAAGGLEVGAGCTSDKSNAHIRLSQSPNTSSDALLLRRTANCVHTVKSDTPETSLIRHISLPLPLSTANGARVGLAKINIRSVKDAKNCCIAPLNS